MKFEKEKHEISQEIRNKTSHSNTVNENLCIEANKVAHVVCFTCGSIVKVGREPLKQSIVNEVQINVDSHRESRGSQQCNSSSGDGRIQAKEILLPFELKSTGLSRDMPELYNTPL